MKVAVVGATGAVGEELRRTLIARKFPVRELVAFASPRSEGRELSWGDASVRCQRLAPGCFSGVDFAFFDASDSVSREWVMSAAESGAWVIDNSAAYREDAEIPLGVPEVNRAAIEAWVKGSGPRHRVIAGPNCTTAQLVVALKPIQDVWGLRRVVISTYQSVSGAGAAAMEELREQTRGSLDGKRAEAKVLAHPIAFNCIPQIGGFRPDGYTSEEDKLMRETRKILGLPELRITATAIRVPTLHCHAESVNVETERPFELSEVRQRLSAFSGLELRDDPANAAYPMGLLSRGGDTVAVGRLRRDSSLENGLNFWVVSDNLRKGAALNAVQLGEVILQAIR